ncbi:MAG: hypothetical protein ABIR70_08920 [Bryobacteraceae bacterium]
MRSSLAVILCAIGLAAQTQSTARDTLIVPGVRVGPVNRLSTEASLLRELGSAAVVADIETGEGNVERGLLLYNDDPARRLAVVFNNEMPPHAGFVFICYPARVEKRKCDWKTADGIGMGTTLLELERLNRRPFTMVAWGSDVGGNVVSYEGGKLDLRNPAAELWLTLYADPGIKLSSQEHDSVNGRERDIPSSAPALRKLNPRVSDLRFVFAR